MMQLGKVRPGTTLNIPFSTFAGATGASITMTGLLSSDIEIYKNGGTTQRGSDAGYTLLDTDGIDFDALTGIHGFSVDLANNTTAGFYESGAQYWIVVSTITVDTQTVSFIAATFEIGYEGAILDTSIATLASQTSFTLTAGPAENDALNGCVVVIHDVASAVQLGTALVSDYVGSTKTVTLAAGTTFTAVATDNISFFPPILNANLDAAVSTRATQVTADAIETNTQNIQSRLPTALVSGRIDASVGAMAAAVLTATAIAADAITAAKIAANAITSSEIADNAITATKIATDAITAAKIAADAIGSSELALTAVNEIRDAILSDSTPFAGANIDATIASRATPAQVNAEVDTALVDVNLDHLVGTATGIPAIPAGTFLDQIMDDGTAVFDRTTDSLQAIRGRGDTAWTTGAGGSPPDLLQNTTIATLASQTSFTLTAGSADNDAYNGATIVVTDSATSTQKAVGEISDYVGSTLTVTLATDPAIFTMAVGDIVDIVAATQRVPGVTLVDTTTTNADMRGTDNAALASVLGALADAAAAGDPTTTETVMQYVKQLINTLEGTTGIPTFPAEAAPANNVSMVEVLRAIHADVTGLNGAAMRGTDNAALASVLGVLADAAAAGDPTVSDTVVAYIKQLINTLEGTTGIPIFPAEAAPANAVSLSEVIRAIHTDVTGLNGAVMRGTDNAALASVATEARLAELDPANVPTDIANVQGDIDNIQTRLPAALVSGRMDSNVTSISNSAGAANRLERGVDGVVLGTVGVASSPTSIVTSSLDPAAAVIDQFKGRIVTFDRFTATVNLRGQSTDITANTAAGVLTVTALTTAPANTDTFVIT